MTGQTCIAVNVEEIMAEIHRKVQMEEDLKNLPAFGDIPVQGVSIAEESRPVQAVHEEQIDWAVLQESLTYVNTHYDIPYYWPFAGSKMKVFFKRVVRKMAKCLLAPIVQMQNTMNAFFVRCVNNLRHGVRELFARTDGLAEELAIVKRMLAAQAKDLTALRQALSDQESAYRERIAALKRKLTDRESAQAEEFAALKEVMSVLAETQENRLAQMETAWAKEADILKAGFSEQGEQLAQQYQACEKMLGELDERLVTQGQTVARQNEELATLRQGQLHAEKVESHVKRWQEDRDLKLAAIARDTIRTKWRLTDYLDAQRDNADEVVRCGICGHAEPRHKLETKESRCIFDGGKLVRYVCPACGAIFGPTKFSRQSEEQFNDDYTVHYTGYHEGDSTQKERHAFTLLHPTKTGIYLNYGCGSWSKTMQQLREDGYQVYGYEPYSKNIDNPYIISDKEQLKRMRFDGIFSNDVLEHLVDPIGELQFMRSLLATPSALMSHCTSCYKYKYEYTRFHMFFFTGDSMEFICQKADLILVDDIEEEAEEPNEFYCKVFKIRDTAIDILPDMVLRMAEPQADVGICIRPGGIVYGPYRTMSPNTYHLEIEIQLPEDTAVQTMNITADDGKKLLRSFELRQGKNVITFDLSEQCERVEFIFQNTFDRDIQLKELAFV